MISLITTAACSAVVMKLSAEKLYVSLMQATTFSQLIAYLYVCYLQFVPSIHSLDGNKLLLQLS